MGRQKATTPTAEEARCPTCGVIDWRRAGERVVEAPGDGDGPAGVRHVLVNEDGPWNWTCERCGHQVRGGSRLDQLLARAQRPAVGGVAIAGLGGLEALRGAWGWLKGAGTGVQATVASGAAAAAVTAAVVVSSVAGTPTSPAAESPSASASSSPSPSASSSVASPSASASSSPSPSASSSVASPSASASSSPAPSGPTPSSPGAPSASASATAATITDAAAILQADDPGLAGTSVELENVPVESVTGDATFWVGTSKTERFFVVLDESRQGEAGVTVRAGQLVRIRGTVEPAPVGQDLPSADRSALERESIYVAADWVEVTRPEP